MRLTFDQMFAHRIGCILLCCMLMGGNRKGFRTTLSAIICIPATSSRHSIACDTSIFSKQMHSGKTGPSSSDQEANFMGTQVHAKAERLEEEDSCSRERGQLAESRADILSSNGTRDDFIEQETQKGRGGRVEGSVVWTGDAGRALVGLVDLCARRGSATAMEGMSILLGVRGLYEDAAGWLELAALSGNARAMFAISDVYAKGRGREEDGEVCTHHIFLQPSVFLV